MPLDSASTRQRLVNSFRAVFPSLTEEEILHANQASVGAWDSLATMTLIGVIEEEFSQKVPPLEMEDFTSYETIALWLEDRNHVS